MHASQMREDRSIVDIGPPFISIFPTALNAVKAVRFRALEERANRSYVVGMKRDISYGFMFRHIGRQNRRPIVANELPSLVNRVRVDPLAK